MKELSRGFTREREPGRCPVHGRSGQARRLPPLLLDRLVRADLGRAPVGGDVLAGRPRGPARARSRRGSRAVLPRAARRRGGTRDSPSTAAFAALEVAGELARRSGRRLETRVADLVSGAPLPEGPFDLVTAVHTVNELWSDRDDRLERRRKLVECLADRLAPGGRVLLVDPALTATANEAIELRDALVAGGWRVLAPCTRGGPVPCASVGNLPRGRRVGTRRRRSVGSATPHASGARAWPSRISCWSPRRRQRPDAAAAASAGARPASGLPLYRVVSERFLAKSGRLRVLLCGPAGRFPLSVDGRSSSPSARVLRSLERYDLVRAEAVEQRATGWGLVPESVLDVAARAPSLGAPGESARRHTDRQHRPVGGAPVTRRATDGRARGLPHHRRGSR